MNVIQSIRVNGETWSIGDNTQHGKIESIAYDNRSIGWKVYIENKGWFRISRLRKYEPVFKKIDHAKENN